MRAPVQVITDSCLAGVSALLGLTLDLMLIRVFRSHLRQTFAAERYRPVYLRSGRRNRAQY
jgi:hypothetical protein